MPCSPNDISVNVPANVPSVSIPGFGSPFATGVPPINPFPTNFPEDLLDLFNKIQFLIPPGSLKPQLTFDKGKSVFDAIMNVMDQFMPILMLYKFFLPILNIIVCVIEVLCSIYKPRKLIRALRRLFKVCIPEFLNMFPIFALITMIISLLVLLLFLIEFIINEIFRLINLVINNLTVLYNAFAVKSEASAIAVIKKIGALFCAFQNLFVLLSIFSIIFQVFNDILNKSFGIPPCDDDNEDGCCTSDVCPGIVKSNYTRLTGRLQYFNQVKVTIPFPMSPSSFESDLRSESWQFYDNSQEEAQRFINIVDAYDVTADSSRYPNPPNKPIFFPTDSNITNKTALEEVPYVVDLTLDYNPVLFGRLGPTRKVIFKNCYVTKPPTTSLLNYKNDPISAVNGVFKIVGGLGYESDGITPLMGFADDNITPTTTQATLETFIKLPAVSGTAPSLNPTDGIDFINVEYTFKPNIEPLAGKGIVTSGCAPDLAFDKNFINQNYAGDVGIKTLQLKAIKLPDTAKAQECLNTALNTLRSGLDEEAVAIFQATSTVCLNNLREETLKALNEVIGIGFDPCKSSFTAEPKTQFTSKPIKVQIELKERNGVSISSNLPSDVATDLATKIKLHTSFGSTSKVTYDGYQYFTSEITSKETGTGELLVSFDNNIFCTIINDPPSRSLQTIKYSFVYAGAPVLSEGDTSDGIQPRRDDGDLAREGAGS